MKHFALEKWADFANGVVSPDERASMERHLEAGCPKCAHVLARWESVRSFANRERLSSPPVDSVGLAKRAFRAYGPTRKQGAARQIAQLIFDSFRQPALEGVRNSGMGTRQLVYQADDVLINLQLEKASGQERLSLVGQVTDSADKDKGIQRVPVLIRYGRDTLAETRTNQFGEFALECETGKRLHVSVGISPRKDVLIPLDESLWRTSVARGKN